MRGGTIGARSGSTARRDNQGRLVGLVRCWNADGVLISTCEHAAGAPHGEARRFYPNGEVAQTCRYVAGALEGVRAFLRPPDPEVEVPRQLAEANDTVTAFECVYDRGDLIGTGWRGAGCRDPRRAVVRVDGELGVVQTVVMCGRYTLTRQDDIVEDLQAVIGQAAQSEWWKPRFNVAPTQPAPVVTRDAATGVRTIEMMRWGLLPHWAGKDGSRPPLMINARVESLDAKAVFRDALERKRCLVPADGFFEWRAAPSTVKGKGKPPKQALYFHPRSHELFAFAGLWARNRTEAGETLSFTIITGPPNALVKPVHDRMPIVLAPSVYDAWLDPTLDGDGAHALLGIPPVADWIAERVGSAVNTAANDDPSCIEPLPPEPEDEPRQRSLFD